MVDLSHVYLFIIFADVVYLFGLLYGGMWYTNKTTVACPQCGVRLSPYQLESHECHPSLVDENRGPQMGGGLGPTRNQ